jgi:DNA-binding NarL/FixJ family response regulator
MPCSVLIVEDDPRIRNLFASAVQAAPDLQLAGAAHDLPEGLRLLEQTRPQVLLVDIGLPSGSGLALIQRAAQHVPECASIVVTVFADEEPVLQCIKAGATGYLLKDARDVDIVQQIRLLNDGGSPISPAIARRLLQHVAGAEPVADGEGPPASDDAHTRVALSEQERAVLSLSAKGYNYEEIAGLLTLSRHTVETYVKRIYRKLQVHSKTEAVYEARKLGLMRD